MPRRSRLRLVPITALIACALPCAGASATPNLNLPIASDAQRVERAAQAETLLALAERKQDRRDAIARERRASNDVVGAARSQIGDGYVYGGSGPDGFDCSGLTAYAFARADQSLPHNSQAQYAMGKPVSRDDIKPGDLVFFSTAGPGASHVGIATSRTRAVSATSSGGVMEHSTTDAYWGGHFVGARRL